MSLELTGVSFSRADRKVISDLSLILRPGAALALLGPNGAGKSTLLGLASGRLKPSSGQVGLEGKEAGLWEPRAFARRLAFLSQSERLPFNYAARDFVLLGRAPHLSPLSLPGPADEAAAEAALKELGVGDLADRPVTELSGGELQLVRLARCLAQEAAYLLLDEPSTALDPANARRLADELRRLRDAGKAILFSTHDAAFAAHVADEAILIRGGEAVASGPALAVLRPELLEAAFGLPFGPARVPSAFAC